MVGSRTLTAAVGVAVSLAASTALWYHFGSLVLFLFVPFLFRGIGGGADEPPPRECPVCGFRTREDGYDYCPRDGHRLERARDRQ